MVDIVMTLDIGDNKIVIVLVIIVQTEEVLVEQHAILQVVIVRLLEPHVLIIVQVAGHYLVLNAPQ